MRGGKMKKILIGLLVLGSCSSFAQTAKCNKKEFLSAANNLKEEILKKVAKEKEIILNETFRADEIKTQSFNIEVKKKFLAGPQVGIRATGEIHLHDGTSYHIKLFQTVYDGYDNPFEEGLMTMKLSEEKRFDQRGNFTARYCTAYNAEGDLSFKIYNMKTLRLVNKRQIVSMNFKVLAD